MHAQVLLGDARAVLATLEDASVDAIVTDPPAGVSFMGKDWDGHKGGRDQWIAWLADIMAEARRCIRPGGYALVWALPRTSHWTAMALEDAGWTIRDSIAHMFGSGFPKSQSCLKPAHETWWLAKAPGPLQPLQIDAARVATNARPLIAGTPKNGAYAGVFRAGSTHAGETMQGRWPPNTLLSHHPECQPAGVRRVRGAGWRDTDGAGGQKIAPGAVLGNRQSALPRPANGHHTDADGYESVDAWTCVDGCPIKALDDQAGSCPSKAGGSSPKSGFWGQAGGCAGVRRDDTGGPSRFFPTFGPDPEDAVPYFYCPKASRAERNAGCADIPGSVGQHYGLTGQGPLAQQTPHHHTPQSNGHPTVKPTALMAWLCKLVTPEGGVVLDCFAGSGSTGVACVREGLGFIGIEMSAEYAAIARARIAHEQEQRAGPLFAGVGTAATAAR